MARLSRVVVMDVPHHVTQRGNAQQVIFAQDADRITYLELLAQYSQLYRLSLLGYCLMSNHVHLIAVPHAPTALADALKQTHGRYACYWNACQASSGHVWQGRFYSCPLDDGHLWEALRYTELNPVRAGLVTAPEQWQWSSAAVHCGCAAPNPILDTQLWQRRWTAAHWLDYLRAGQSPADLAQLRRCTFTGRPLGTPNFLAKLEHSTRRRLAPRPGGRPKKPSPDCRQDSFPFVA